MTTTSLLDAGSEPATAAPAGRRYTCRYLSGAGMAATRCTAEPVEPPEDGPEVELCTRHLAAALALLRRRAEAAGVPDYVAEAREVLAAVEDRFREHGRQILADRIASGELVRLPAT